MKKPRKVAIEHVRGHGKLRCNGIIFDERYITDVKIDVARNSIKKKRPNNAKKTELLNG